MSVLGHNSESANDRPVSVWTTSLGLGTLPALLAVFLRHGRFQLQYNAASGVGRALAGILRATGILSSSPRLVEFSLHGLRVDDPKSPRHLVQGWLPNQFTDRFMANNAKMLESLVYPDPRVRRGSVLINLRKAAAQTATDVLAFLEFARYRHQEDGMAYHRLAIITPHGSLAHLLSSDWVGEDVEFLTPWSLQFLLIMRLGRSFLRFLKDSLRPKKQKASGPTTIAAAAAWGIDSSARLNDLFWWWDSGISPDRTILFFDRTDTTATSDIVAKAEQMGIRCVVLDPESVGNSPHLLWKAAPGLRTAATRFWRACRLFGWGTLRGPSRGWITRQALDMLHNSERMEDFLSDFNVAGLIHHQDGGLDHISLASDAVGAARIGHHWSYFPWPETAVARLHQVYFVWGEHQAKLLEANGSGVDHVLWSGCPVNGAYPGSDASEARNTFRSAVEASGASRVLALFDTSLPCENFYEYFLRKTIQDQRWGLLIKPKNRHLPWLRYNLPDLESLYEEALATGRVILMDHALPPSQAAAAADFAVAVDINSAAVCSALAGHRSIHLDYPRIHAGPLADWATLYKAGPDRLVFDDPDRLWECLNRHLDQRESDPSLGLAEDKTLEYIDPFRDGRAGERIGQYLGWYLEALDTGLGRDPALEHADARYASAWGARAVASGIHGPSRSSGEVPPSPTAVSSPLDREIMSGTPR